MVAVNAVGNGQGEQFRPSEDAPEKELPVIYLAFVKHPDN
jgi:hypothetical protein